MLDRAKELKCLDVMQSIPIKIEVVQDCGTTIASGYFVCFHKGDIVLSERCIAVDVLRANRKLIPTSGPGITRISADMNVVVPSADIIFLLSENGSKSR